MEISKTPIPLDDEETIKRFTEEIHRRSIPITSQQYRAEVIQSPTPSHGLEEETNTVDRVKNQSTQTEPVTITVNIYPNGQKSTGSKGSAGENLTLDHAKLRNPALDSVIAQSPQISGVRAPPSTPETIPNYEISQMIADAIDDLPPEAFSSLGDSRFAPRRPLAPKTSTENKSSPILKDPIYSGLNSHTSPADRKSNDESFARMSFKAADSSPTSPDGKFPESVFIKDVQSSKWADEPAERTLWNRTNTGIPRVGGNPFSVLSDSIDKETKGSVGTSGSVRSDTDDIEKSVSVKRTGVGQAYVPPHLRILEKSSGDLESMDKKFAQQTENLKLSDGSRNSAPKGIATRPLNHTVKPAFEGEKSANRAVGPALKPYPVVFNAVSSPAKDENLEGALFFNAWPKLEERSKPAAKIRKVIISGIPLPDSKLVASLVYGGALDHFYMRDKSAVVVFLRAEDCQKYYDDTPNGVQYKRDGKDCTAFVELSDDVDVIGGQLAMYIEKGFTRCVRAIGVNPDIPFTRLWAKAEDKNRRVEFIEDGKSAAGLRSVVFRFEDIRYAVAFKLSLEREPDFDHCNIHFFPDPCETATGPHF